MELTTIAKPYANAVFEIAQQSKSHSDWKAVLEVGTLIAEDAMMCAFVASPSASKLKKAKAVIAVFESSLDRALSKKEKAFIGLLLENGRLSVLPSILALFNAKMGLESDAKVFQITSAYQLSTEEEKKIVSDLADKYNTTVRINTMVDKNLVGSIVIKEGDKVIDLSVKARVDALSSCLSIN